jgi:hypothetical protein
MARCRDCVNVIVLDDPKGECHLAPPIPVGEYPLGHSSWPIVHLDNDECAQYSAGVHAGTTCDGCTNYSAISFLDPGSCANPDKPEADDSICADAECHAIPPTPVGEYRGDRSLWPRVQDGDYTCSSCYDASGGGPL